MPIFGGSYNPADVMLRRDPIQIGGSKPYLPVSNPQKRPAQPQQPKVLGAEAIRATGSGPYDPAYRQDLATYAGGLFQRPGGFLGLNPTGSLSGNPTGGGNAPVPGTQNDLLSMALGGQSFLSPPAQQAKPASAPAKQQKPANDNFLERYLGAGRYLRGY